MASKKQFTNHGFSERGMILALKGFGLSHGLVMRTMDKLGVPISYNTVTDTMTNWKNNQIVGNLEYQEYTDLLELRRTDPDAYYKKLNYEKRHRLQLKQNKWKNKAFSISSFNNNLNRHQDRSESNHPMPLNKSNSFLKESMLLPRNPNYVDRLKKKQHNLEMQRSRRANFNLDSDSDSNDNLDDISKLVQPKRIHQQDQPDSDNGEESDYNRGINRYGLSSDILESQKDMNYDQKPKNNFKVIKKYNTDKSLFD